MKSIMRTEGQTILLEGTVLKPTEADMQRVQRIRDELAERHDVEGGKIVHLSSKRSGYRRLTIQWRSQTELLENGL